MSATLNFFDTYSLIAITKEIVPKQTFFHDRYFPTGAGDIFASDKVLTEYQKGNRRMAAFVAPRVGDIPVDRKGYTIHEYQPAYIAPSRLLTIDDLKKRGFGEALYPGMTQAQRAAQLQLNDMTELDTIIGRREEWMCSQTILNNACTMQEYVDATTKGEELSVQFYDDASDHEYTVAEAWSDSAKTIFGDIRNMCKMLTTRGLPATDLIVGIDVADALVYCQEIRDLLDKMSGVIVGELNAQKRYEGVVYLGRLNIGGYVLNIYSVDESYEDDDGETQAYWPADAVCVTAPGCGHLMYGQITQMDYGQDTFTTHTGSRIPKFVVNQETEIRKLRLACRPLAAPTNYCPWIVAQNVLG